MPRQCWHGAAAYHGAVRQLSADELVHESEATAALIEDLVRIGALKPDSTGRFSSRDIARVRIAQSYISAGLGLDALEQALAEQFFSFDYIDRFYMEPVARSTQTFAEFRTSVGPAAVDLGAIYAAFGLAEPGPDSHLPTDEEEIIRAFLDTWGRVADREGLLRAARVNGEPVRRLAEAIVALCYQTLSMPHRNRDLTFAELIRMVADPARRLAALQPRLIVWLERRHTEQVMHRINFSELERVFIEHGWTPPRSAEVPAIAFVDLSGFTSMTEEEGDELAARLAGRLQNLAESAVQGHHGRVVKLLGDGVMLRFDRPADAVQATLEVVDGAPSADLPMAHAGIHAGPLIERDGDFYGHTVNLAARVLGRAGSGQVVVTDAVVDQVDESALYFEPLDSVALKGIANPVALYLASRRSSPG